MGAGVSDNGREGGGVPTLSMANIRSLCLLVAVGVTFTIFTWMFVEQDKVRSCIDLRQDPISTQPQTQADAPISALIQALAQLQRPPPASENKTDSAKVAKGWNYDWDAKAWPSKADAVGVPERTLILVRHGKYDYATGLLTDLGRQQANLTGQRLRTLGLPYSTIIHSPLARAQETAQIVHSYLSHLPMVEDALLEEGGPVPPEPTVSYWGLPKRDYFVNGPRMESAFRKYFHRADKTQTQNSFEIIVGHGNLFRFFALRALQLPPNAWMRVFIAHASITQINMAADGTVSMTRFGDAGHFPPEMVTY